ncbi:MAG: hypothetical protein ACM3QU_03650 [Verrucomicrobiota bacterium]
MLVIRAWVEGRELRARVTHTRDIGSARAVSAGAASIEEVVRLVEQWLRSFVGTA